MTLYAADSTVTRKWNLLFVHLARRRKEGRIKRENIQFGQRNRISGTRNCETRKDSYSQYTLSSGMAAGDQRRERAAFGIENSHEKCLSNNFYVPNPKYASINPHSHELTDFRITHTPAALPKG